MHWRLLGSQFFLSYLYFVCAVVVDIIVVFRLFWFRYFSLNSQSKTVHVVPALPKAAMNLTNGSHPSSNMTSPCLVRPGNTSIYCLTVAYAAVFIVALVANALVIKKASRRRANNGRRPFDKLIINMAVADTLDTFTGIPLNAMFLHFGLKWFPGGFGSFLCKAVHFLMNVSIATSAFTFCFIAVDRFRAIVLETKRPFSSRAIKLAIAHVWLAACLLYTHNWLVFDVHQNRGMYFCYQSRTFYNIQVTRIEMTLMFFLTYAVPLPLAAVLYSLMISYLWQWQIPGHRNEIVLRRVHTQKKRMTKILITILAAFAVCWFPVHILNLVIAYKQEVYRCLPIALELAIYWLAHTNSAINPCLYLYMNSRWHKTKPIQTLIPLASPRPPITANSNVFHVTNMYR